MTRTQYLHVTAASSTSQKERGKLNSFWSDMSMVSSLFWLNYCLYINIFTAKYVNNKIIFGCLVFPKKNLHVRQISNSMINDHFPYNSIFTPHDEDAQYIIVNIYCMIWYDYFLYYFLHNLHTAVDNCSIKFYLLIFYTKHGNQIFQASCGDSEF